jgi:hypothetical protein
MTVLSKPMTTEAPEATEEYKYLTFRWNEIKAKYEPVWLTDEEFKNHSAKVKISIYEDKFTVEKSGDAS